MSKQALDYKKGITFQAPPEDITIVGLDTDDGPEHPAWQERAKLPVDKALAIGQVAQAQNVSVQTVKFWMKWYDLDREVQRAIEKKDLSFTAAVNLSTLNREKQKTELRRLTSESGKVTVSRAKASVSRKPGEAPSIVPPSKKLLNKLLKRADEENELPELFLEGIRYAIGKTDGLSIHKLRQILSELEK